MTNPKVAHQTGVTSQDGAYLRESLLSPPSVGLKHLQANP